MALKLVQGKQITVNLTGSFTGSFTGDGSGLINLPVQSINTGSFVTTSSFNNFTSSYNTGSFTGSFIGSLSGTASFATNALTASYLEGYISPFPFTGSALITGSLKVTGSLNVTQGITGSLFGTASWAINSITSSFITGSNVFGPFGSNSIISASFAISSSRAVTSSFAISSSFATSASFATTASFSISSSFATTASFALNAGTTINTGSFVTTSSFNAFTSSYNTGSFTGSFTGSLLGTASFATIAGNANSISSSITNNVNNYVLTATGTGVINGEANLQFNGTTLNVLGSLQNGQPGNADGANSHTEGFKSTTLLNYSHAEGTSTYTGQDGYDVVDMGNDGSLILDGTYGNITSNFTATGGFILFDDTKYSNTYGFRRLQYTSVAYDGSKTVIYLSDKTIITPDAKATVGIPGVATLGNAKNIVPFTKTANHAEGSLTIADGEASHAEGSGSTSIGDYSHAEGIRTQAIGSGSHTEGSNTLAVGNYSHAEGLQTQTINPNSHTEGNSTYTGQYGYEAEYGGSPGEYRLLTKYGNVTSSFTNTYVIVDDTFEDNTVGLKEVEFEAVSFSGARTDITLTEELTTSKLYIGISGVFAPVTADKIIPVNKESSHAEGSGSFALGTGAHAEGYNTRAIGNYSNTKGLGTIAEGEGQVVIGKYNVPTASSDISFIVGHGTGENDRRNVMYIQNRDVFMLGGLTVNQTIIGSLFGTASWATNSLTSSYITSSNVFGPFGANSILSASFAISSSRAVTSSFAISSSFATSASFATTASYSLSSSFAVSSSRAVTSSFATSASFAVSSSRAVSSSFAISASWAPTQTIDTSSLVTTASFNAFTSSYNTGSFTGSFRGDGSGLTNLPVQNIDTSSLVTTASFNVFTSSYNTGSFTGSFTGTLIGTSSWAINAITASYASNGGVTQLLAGPNITLAPTNGLGQVTISSTAGGGSSFNTATGSYGSFYDTTIQTNVAGTARSMSLNTTDISNGVSISGSTNPFNTYIKTENAGVYDIQFSAQVDKTDSGTDEIWIWLRKNGTNLADTATSVQLTGNGAHYVAAWNFFVNAAANDYFQLMWYSPDANVRLHAEAAFGVVPGIPSLIVTVNRVDQFLSNTGSFSGSFTGQFTGSLFGTSSWATNSLTSSFITGSNVFGPFDANSILSASYAISSSRAVSSSFATTASFIENAQTASYVLQAVSSSFATTASYALNGGVTQIIAGTNITITNGGSGSVIINSTGGGGGGTDLGLVQAMTVGLQNIF